MFAAFTKTNIDFADIFHSLQHAINFLLSSLMTTDEVKVNQSGCHFAHVLKNAFLLKEISFCWVFILFICLFGIEYFYVAVLASLTPDEKANYFIVYPLVKALIINL